MSNQWMPILASWHRSDRDGGPQPESEDFFTSLSIRPRVFQVIKRDQLGVALSQDASGKWRFRLGFPAEHVIITPDGHCYWDGATSNGSTWNLKKRNPVEFVLIHQCPVLQFQVSQTWKLFRSTRQYQYLSGNSAPTKIHDLPKRKRLMNAYMKAVFKPPFSKHNKLYTPWN